MQRENPEFMSVNGLWKTKVIFYEKCYSHNDSSEAMFTLKPHDHKHCKSLYLIYMDLDDITEYKIATEVLGGWAHWKALCSCKWFKPYLEEWREELRVRTKQRSLESLKHDAMDPDSKNYNNALKFLLDRGWDPEGKDVTAPSHTKGRGGSSQASSKGKEDTSKKVLDLDDLLDQHHDNFVSSKN